MHSLLSLKEQSYDATKRIMKVKNVSTRPPKEIYQHVQSSMYGTRSSYDQTANNSPSTTQEDGGAYHYMPIRPNRHRYNHSQQTDVQFQPNIPYLQQSDCTQLMSSQPGNAIQKKLRLDFKSMSDQDLNH